MIPQIKEINFPEYATLSTATVTLNDMGDRTISAQVKIDGAVVPDFSFDWEVEFQGERYIHPVREPQASKGNDSICSTIDLTFQHWTIYQLRRYFFVEMTTTDSGTAMADKYIASLSVNLKTFCDAFQRVLDYYYNGEITIDLNPDWEYNEEVSYIEISYTHIWDVLQKIYEVYGVRWTIEGTTIKVGYPTEEVSHIFEYGFEGGLLKVERQVQSTDIRNSLLGRGGEKNLPYRYFKDEETDAQGYKWSADPDWIPELENIYFTELRGKTFRDYIKGWKAQRYGGEPMEEPTEEYNRGYADSAKSEDGRYFNPIEYVEDKESIEKYGLLQGGLENQEDIYPSIQGVEVEPYGRIDEIVGAEQVIIDEATSDYTPKAVTMSIDDTFTGDQIEATDVENEYILRSNTIHQFSDGSVGYILSNPLFKTTYSITYLDLQYLQFKIENGELDTDLLSYKVLDVDNNSYLKNIVSIPSGLRFKVEYRVRIKPHSLGSASVTSSYIFITSNWSMSSRPFAGEILENLNADGTRRSATISVPSKETKSVTIQSDTFTVPENGATNIDVPVSINTDLEGEGLYEWKRDIEAVNTETNEVVTSINIPQGTYYLRVNVEITNNSDSAYEYKVDLLPSYILYPSDTEEFKPTFDIWIKNLWGTTRNSGESAEEYAERVWRPILGDRQGNEAKIVFTSGWLAGHSDYEFTIRDFAYAGGDGVEYNGVKAEWRLTLVKSEAEIEATGKWIPSTTQQANAGDHFFFIGIDMPHQYVLWAEEELDDYKRDQLLNTAHIKPTWVVQTDKVRLNQLQEGETEPLLNALKVGNSLRIADTRFTNGVAQPLYLQSITYSWDAQTVLLPNVEVVLSDKVTTSLNPVARLQGEVDVLAKQVGSISNVQQVVRAVGDKLYLRKDGVEDVSNSPTEFANLLSSKGFRQGAVGGSGWGLRSEQGKGIFEVDKLIVRDEMQVNSLVVNQVSAIGGKEILSAASITCTRVETTEQGYKCYFDQKQGSVANLFQVNDIAYSQVFNANDIEIKYYKRNVIDISDNSITLSLEGDGDGMPQEGDVIVHYGNTTDPNRQYVIIRDVICGGYERMLSDLNSVTASGTEYYFAGRLDGRTPRWFVGDSQGDHIEYKDGKLNITADVTFGSGSSGLTEIPEFGDLVDRMDNVEETTATEYVIWFVEDGATEDYAPTLDNYPAVDWTTEEMIADHEWDIFYNRYSGQAWRFLSGDWTEITDADTIAALTKASEAKKQAEALLYIKNALDTDNMTTNISNGLVLTGFVGVKDASENIVAAMMNATAGGENQPVLPYFAAGITDATRISESSKLKIDIDGRIEQRDTDATNLELQRRLKMSVGQIEFSLGENAPEVRLTPDKHVATPSDVMMFKELAQETTEAELKVRLPQNVRLIDSGNFEGQSGATVKRIASIQIGRYCDKITVPAGTVTSQSYTHTFAITPRLVTDDGVQIAEGSEVTIGHRTATSETLGVIGAITYNTSANDVVFNKVVHFELVYTTTKTGEMPDVIVPSFGAVVEYKAFRLDDTYLYITATNNISRSAYDNVFFGNGLFFAKSATQYGGLLVDDTNGAVMEFRNGNQGLRFSAQGLQKWDGEKWVSL